MDQWGGGGSRGVSEKPKARAKRDCVTGGEACTFCPRPLFDSREGLGSGTLQRFYIFFLGGGIGRKKKAKTKRGKKKKKEDGAPNEGSFIK